MYPETFPVDRTYSTTTTPNNVVHCISIHCTRISEKYYKEDYVFMFNITRNEITRSSNQEPRQSVISKRKVIDSMNDCSTELYNSYSNICYPTLDGNCGVPKDLKYHLPSLLNNTGVYVYWFLCSKVNVIFCIPKSLKWILSMALL